MLCIAKRTQCPTALDLLMERYWEPLDRMEVFYKTSPIMGKKRKHALKFQAIVCPDGLILHAFGPLEGRRQDWTLYTQSGIETQLAANSVVDGQHYCLYGDSGYAERDFISIPFQRADLIPAQVAFNKAMSACRVNVEWEFKEIKRYRSTVDFKRKLRVQQ